MNASLPSIGRALTSRQISAVVGFIVASGIVMFVVLPVTWLYPMTASLIYAIVVLSLVVVVGYCGQLSLAQYMLAGVGAWISAKLIAGPHFSFELAALVAIVGTVFGGTLVALPAVRTRGVNLAVVTLGLGVIVQEMIFGNDRLTPGNIPIGTVHLFGIDVNPVTHPSRYGFVVVLAFGLSVLLAFNLRSSTTGRKLIAVRSNERAAAALGISVFGAKLYAFGVGAGLASLAGILTAYQNTTVQMSPYQLMNSINVVLIASIAGIGHVVGSVLSLGLAPDGLGTRIFLGFGDVNRWIQTYSGALLVLTLLANPNGLADSNFNKAIGRGVARLFRPLSTRITGRRWASDQGVERSEALGGSAVRVVPKCLEVDDLTVRYGGVVAVEGVSLQVRPGEVTGLIGPNGAGKTSLVDAVTGFTRIANGRVLLDGKELQPLSPHRRAQLGVSRSFQGLDLFEELSVEENIRAAADPKRRGGWLLDLVSPRRTPLEGGAAAAVHDLRLENCLHQRVSDLSYGERRLVAIARSLASNPSVLLLDEPAAGLDEQETDELAALVVRIAKEWGVGILLIEHDVNLVMKVSDSVTVLEFGRVIADGRPDRVRSDPEVIRAYLGQPENATEDETVAHSFEAIE